MVNVEAVLELGSFFATIIVKWIKQKSSMETKYRTKYDSEHDICRF